MNELAELLDAVAYAEATTGEVVACRRPGAVLAPQMCRGCPVWGTCKGFGVQHPGVLGTDGDELDPTRKLRKRWRVRVEQINREAT